MKVTVSFGNPFTITFYTVAMMMIGWAIGARWWHLLSSARMIFFATIFLLLHDAALAIMIALFAIKVASCGGRQRPRERRSHQEIRAAASQTGAPCGQSNTKTAQEEERS